MQASSSFVPRSLAALALVTLAACGGDSPAPSGPSELQIEDLVVGTGATAVTGDTLVVHYIGTFLDGKKFDSSYDRGKPLDPFPLGAGAVIKGWDQGLVGMRVGGKRRLTIPAALAYGSQGSPPTIPPNTPLRFEIDLIAIIGK
jgi:peptidylprolyl isomerase/FKBP-type peptidyl-prolyl cis-trans isomerase FkpA